MDATWRFLPVLAINLLPKADLCLGIELHQHMATNALRAHPGNPYMHFEQQEFLVRHGIRDLIFDAGIG